MEDVANQRDSLLSWASKLTKKQISNVKQLSDGKIFKSLMEMSTDFSTISNNDLEGWKGNYFMLQSQFKQLQRFYKQKTNSLPKNLDPLNLVDMAKGQDQQGLLGMLKFVFLSCVKAQNPKYIQQIMQLEQKDQKIFHKLIQQSSCQNEVSIDTQQNKQKQKINELMFHLQSISFQHQSLKSQFQEEVQNNLKLKQINKKLQQQNKKLKKDLSQSLIIIRSKEQQVDQSTNKIINDSNTQIIQQLKKSLYQQQQKYGTKLRQMQQKIEILQDQLAQSRNFTSQYQSRQSQYNPVDHTKCITLKKYNQEIAKYSAQIKQKTQNQHKANMQLIQHKNKIEQLKAVKLKLQANQNQQKNYIDKGQADQFKIQMCKMLRDKLKKTLQETKNQNLMIKKNKDKQKQNIKSEDELNLLLQSQIESQNQSKKKSSVQNLL